ncbi:MAG: LEA type 2 family protein [Treponema sp.]|jgi:LEA14-like dessication related protein|nr:LEA type 2 family protein [Treponema sp.]
MRFSWRPRPVLSAAALFLLVLAGDGCQSLGGLVSEPVISFHSVSITGLSFTGAELLAKVNVKNDNSLTIPFPELDWEFLITGRSFLAGTIKNDKKIAARSTTVVDVPFRVNYADLYRIMTGLADAGEVPYKVNVGARFPIPLLETKTFKASFSGSIPLLKTPALSFGGVTFNTVGVSKVEFVLTWTVENKNAFALNLDKLDYRFSVNGDSWASGAAPPRLSLPPRSSTPIPITVSLNTASMIQGILRLAFDGKPVNYTCGGEAALSPQGLNAAALRLPFNYSGTTVVKKP